MHKTNNQNKFCEAMNQVTLIIPTYNRPHYLARLLKYYASKKTQIRFLILDSGNMESRKLNEQAANILGEQVRYLTFPSSMPVATKLLEGLKLVETKFCGFCADDDLVFVDGLSAAVNFLENNDEYVCADGIYLNFNQVGNDVQLHVEYATKGITAEDPAARVFKLFQKYESLFYGVFLTKNAIKVFEGVSKNTSLHYQELFQAASALLIGKSHRLPIFYAGRQSCVAAEQDRDKWQTYYWFADNPKEFIEHYLMYREILWQFYQLHGSDKKYSKESFSQTMDIAHAMYFGLGCPPEYFYSTLQAKWPNDVFKKANEYQENICNHFKNPKRLKLEAFTEKFALWLPKKIASLHFKHYTRRLNSVVQKKTKTSLNCVLSSEIKWMAGVDNFKNTYLELCRYMAS